MSQSIEEAIAIAERRWPGLEFKRKNYEEASSACPFCRDGEDRFLVFAKGNFWCRQCESKGSLTTKDPSHKLTEKELTDIRLKKLERQQEKLIHRVSALERMHQCQDHIHYHQQMDSDDLDYWHRQGINDESIRRYLLGVCYRCPTDSAHRPSYTIPIVNHGKLCNIRHRLIGDGKGKYRPHMKDLGNTLFNADNLYTGADTVMIVEGAKKCIVLNQYGLLTVGTMGIEGFPEAWARRFEPFKEILVAFDPDAQSKAHKIAPYFGGRAKVISLPVKPDDFFVEGGTLEEFREFLYWGKPVKGD